MESSKKTRVISFHRASILSVIVIVILFTISILIDNQIDIRSWFGDLSTLFASFFVFLSLVCTTRAFKSRNNKNYKVWLILTLAQLSFFIGDFIWAFIELGLNQQPFPSIADIFYLGFYPLFALAIFLIPSVKQEKAESYKNIIDITIIIIASSLFFWSLLILPTLQQTNQEPLDSALSILYIILDLILLFSLLKLIFRQTKSLSFQTLLLLCSALFVQVITDFIYSYQSLQGTYISGSPLDLGWIITFILIGLAGIWESEQLENQNKDGSRHNMPIKFSWTIYIPYALVFASYLLLILKSDPDPLFSILEAGVGVTIFLVVLRQILSFQENQKLYMEANEELKKRKLAEKNLKSERDKAQRYFNIAGVILLVLDPDGKVNLINQRGIEILGYKKEDIIGKDWVENFVPTQKKHLIKKVINRLINKKDLERFRVGESEIITKDNRMKIIRWHSTVLENEKNEVIGILTSGEDVTLRREREKEIELKTQQTIQRQATLLDLIRKDFNDLKTAFNTYTEASSLILGVERVSIWFLSPDGSQIECEDLYQYSINKHTKGDILKEENCPNYFEAIKHSHNLAITDAKEDMRTKEFKNDYLEPLNIISLLDVPIWSKGRIIGVLCQEEVGYEKREWKVEDQDFAVSIAGLISYQIESDERRKVQEELSKSREDIKDLKDYLEAIINASPFAIIDVTPEGRVNSIWNPAAEKIYGWKREEVLGKKLPLIPYNKESEHISFRNKALKGQNVGAVEVSRKNKNGDHIDILLALAPIFNSKGEVKAILSTSADITESVKDKKQINDSLKEKELLLREIHHRVKNNMQVISSLLSLQSRYIDDEDAFDVFKESQNRVKSMAIVHEKLYESDRLDEINMYLYVASLISSLSASYLSSNDKIDIKTEIEDIYLNIDTAIPLGLIINELITNSLKHAFKETKEGNILIKMFKTDKKITLIVSDDGKGIPEGLDYKETKSLGLILINSLVGQIDGSIELLKKPGTTFEIIFEEVQYSKRI